MLVSSYYLCSKNTVSLNEIQCKVQKRKLPMWEAFS